MTRSDITAALTGEGMMTKCTGGRERPARDEIARLAYQFYETRGRRPLIITHGWPGSVFELIKLIGPVPAGAGANSNSGRQKDKPVRS